MNRIIINPIRKEAELNVSAFEFRELLLMSLPHFMQNSLNCTNILFLNHFACGDFCSHLCFPFLNKVIYWHIDTNDKPKSTDWQIFEIAESQAIFRETTRKSSKIKMLFIHTFNTMAYFARRLTGNCIKDKIAKKIVIENALFAEKELKSPKFTCCTHASEQ